MKKSKFWIKKDRENYFLGGIIVTCAIACLVSSYWHRSDRLSVAPNIRIVKKSMSKATEYKKLKEAQFYSPTQKKGAGRYYKMEEESTLPKIPDLKDDDDD